jgi:hypothetical protein
MTGFNGATRTKSSTASMVPRSCIANDEGSISGAIVEEFRFDFADQVVERLLSRTDSFVMEELADTVAEFPIRTEAFRMFADEAFVGFLIT